MKRRNFIKSLLALPVVSSLFSEADAKLLDAPPVPQLNAFKGLSSNTDYYYRARVYDGVDSPTFKYQFRAGDWSEWTDFDPKTGTLKNG